MNYSLALTMLQKFINTFFKYSSKKLHSYNIRMSSPPQGSPKKSEFNSCKIEFNPNASHFIWFSPALPKDSDLTKKFEKTTTDIQDLNDLDKEIEENFNLEKFEDLKKPNKLPSTSKSNIQSIKQPSENEKNECPIKTKSAHIQKWRHTKTKLSAIQAFKSKTVHFMKESRFAGIPLAMSK